MFLSYYRAHMLDTTDLYPGVRDTLDRLTDCKLAVLTNKPVHFSCAMLDGLGIYKHFVAVYGGNSFDHKKPDPVGVFQILADTKGHRDRTWMVGDSAVDVLTGRNASIQTCGVTYGYATEALPAWSRMTAPKRGEIVERAGDLLRAEQDDVARLLTREEGKTIAEARGEIYRAYNVINYTAGQSRRMGGITIPSELPRNFVYTIRQPLGVVALITPWNFPICIPAWKIAPALVAGNTVVFKPSSTTPLTAAK